MCGFHENVTRAWGQKGEQWLASLPSLIKEISHSWQLSDIQQLSQLSYNYCAQAVRGNDKQPVILKIGYDVQQIEREAVTLRFYEGIGSVKLLDTQLSLGALLLERLDTSANASLKSLFPAQDEQAIEYAVQVMKQLHSHQLPESTGLPGIEDWLVDLTNVEHTEVPCLYLRQAQELAFDLLSTQETVVLLHGDLHHGNIIKRASGESLMWFERLTMSDEKKSLVLSLSKDTSDTTNSWVAIDPKGVIGEPAYEVGAFIRNPLPDLLQQPNKGAIISRRLNLFSKLLSLDRQRVKDWSYVQAILAARWAEEDGGDWQYFIRCAELIEGL